MMVIRDDRAGRICFALSILALLPLLARGPLDQEEYDLGVFSGRLVFESLWHGRLSFWLPDLGLGTPMPIGQSFGAYAPFALSDILGLSLWFCTFWIFQLWLGTYCLYRLCRRIGVAPGIAVVAALTFALSMPTINYGMTDDWPTAFFTWTMYPVVVYLLTSVLVDRQGKNLHSSCAVLAVATGFWLAKAHPGHIAVLLVPFAAYWAVLCPWRSRRVWLGLGFVAVLAGLMALDTYTFLASEFASFPPNLVRASQPGYEASAFLRALIFPLSDSTHVVVDGWRAILLNHYSRGPFFGAPFMLCAAGFVVWSIFKRSRLNAALSAALLISIAISLADNSVSKVASGLWLARDPLTLFGILAASRAIAALDAATEKWRRIYPKLIIAQSAHMLIAFVPFVVYVGFHIGTSPEFAHRFHYRGEDSPSAFKSWLTANGKRTGERFFLSSRVQNDLRGGWIHEGVYGYTELVRLGLPVVTGWFKNVSMDAIYPSSSLMHGRIEGNDAAWGNRNFLDIAGVRWILVSGEETTLVAGKASLGKASTYRGRDGRILALFENPDAWPRAVFLGTGFEQSSRLPRLSGCPFTGIICADLSSIKDARLTGTIDAQFDRENITLRFSPANSPRQVLLSVFAHDGWIARAGNMELPLAKVDGALLGVPVPAGVSEIHLSYSPPWQFLATAISAGTGSLLLIFMVLLTLRQRRMAGRSGIA